jgi:hypothetical protein
LLLVCVRRDTLGGTGSDLRIKGGLRVGLATLPGNASVLIFVLRVAGGAAGLLYVGANHRHNRVVGHSPLARAVIVQNVTKPELALLHPKSPVRIRWRGKELRKAEAILAELVKPVQPLPNVRQLGSDRLGRRRLRRPFQAYRRAGRELTEDISLESITRGPPLVQGQGSERPPLGYELSHEPANDFMRAAKWHAAPDQIVRHVSRKQHA